MTKKEIVKAISEELGLTQLQTKAIVQKTFESIIDTLVEDPRHRIELRNFGVFEVKKRAARKARNPRTNERVDVDEKYVVTFKPGKEMEERVGRLVMEQEQKKAEEEQQEQPTGAASPAQETSESTPATPPSSEPATPEERPRSDMPGNQPSSIDPSTVSSPYNH